MKNLVLKSALAILIAFGFTSCKIDIGDKGITGSGNITTQTRNVGNFTKVSAERGLDVVIEMADQTSVVVEADDNLQSHIKTTVENGELTITSDYNSYTNVKSKKVTVKMPVIKGIDIKSGASLKSANTLRSDNFTIETSSGSEADITVESEKIVAESSSGSHMTLRGKALSLDTSSSSGSEIDADNLIANDVTAQSSSGSSTDVHAAVSIQAKASSGSSVEFKGSPKNVTKDESSGGSVSGS